MSTERLEPKYTGSHALIIGINKYKHLSPLGYAVNDAKSVASILKTTYEFPKDNVHLLLDQRATRAAITQRFLALATEQTEVNDRVFVFFAGHGYTVHSRRGEVGFLVPYDGGAQDLSSLIRWDELTRNADLIPAKHMLFIMDACYGGLAITRALQPGSMRFLKDMLLRYARQVLTAGKADEVVADLGGPKPNHSVFTGHFLEALEGKASDTNGIITANGVMAYVYRQVGNDPQSRQTPHFGYMDGDGDFVFKASVLAQLTEEPEEDKDLLISVPSVTSKNESSDEKPLIDRTKEYLSDQRYLIKLHDLVAGGTRDVLSRTSEDYFPIQEKWSSEGFSQRLKRYETATEELGAVMALTAYWGSANHLRILTMPFEHLSGRLSPESGLTVWLALRWYPALLLSYSAGIAAIAAGKYDNLSSLLNVEIWNPLRQEHQSLVLVLGHSISETHDAYKTLPGHERNYAPRSDYLYKSLQPGLDDLLFLGTEYESAFDRFEVFFALVHADKYSSEEHGRLWGPVGRFGWKYRSTRGASPFHRILAEADKEKDSWPPLRSGLFGGSFERFRAVTMGFAKDILSQLSWF